MKVLVQWATTDAADWQEVDAAAWKRLPKKAMPARGELGGADGLPGYIAHVSIQGMRFGQGDHYACEPITGGGVKLSEWADDPEDWPVGQRWALEHSFWPLAPDPNLGGAINARQQRVIYAEPGAMLRLRTAAPTDEFREWGEFVPPAEAVTRHGIWMPDALFKRHRAAVLANTPGWRDPPWTEHLPAEELDGRGRLKQQRLQGRYPKSQHTITYICRDTDRAVGWAAAIHEDALERTTGVLATETREVPNATAQPGESVWAFTSPANDPNDADWPLGDYRVQYDIAVLDSGVSVGQTDWGRVSADATSLANIGVNATDVTVTGLTIRSINVDPPAGAADERYGVHVRCANSNTHGGNQTITLNLNTADTFADGPWTPSETPVSSQRSGLIEALQTIAGSRAGQIEAQQVIAASKSGLFEAAGSIARQLIGQIEAAQSLAGARTGQQEALQTALTALIGQMEAFALITAGRSGDHEAAGSLAVGRFGEHEAVQPIVRALVGQHEALFSLLPVGSGLQEALLGVSSQRGGDHEAAGSLAVGRVGQHEAALSLLRALAGWHEALQAMVQPGSGLHEALQLVSSQRSGDQEAGGTLVVVRSGVHEAAGILTIARGGQFESLVSVAGTLVGQFEASSSVAVQRTGQHESMYEGIEFFRKTVLEGHFGKKTTLQGRFGKKTQIEGEV